MFITKIGLVRALTALAAVAATPAQAQTPADLKVGLSAEPTSLDPHFHNLVPNNQVTGHIFESLVEATPNFSMRPGLAESYRVINPTTWEFILRKNVKFHDGSSFDANDVIFSLCRIPKVANSPSPFTLYTKAIQEIETPDAYTLIIKTKAPYPLLPQELSVVNIISDGLIGGEKVKFNHDGCKINAAWPTTADFTNGKNAIGTGPYKYAEFVKGDRIVFKRNEAYWGDKPQWETVLMRPISSPGPRVAALISGDVDFIENPPIQDVQRLSNDSKFKISGGVSARVIYVMPDQRSDAVPPEVKGTNGKNPFRDVRVRKALAIAIDRQAIVERVIGGFAKPANQLLDKAFFGANLDIPKIAFDPEGAKKLLAEAGYPNGFEMTLATPNDRYVNDAQIAQAVAQMWSRIGIKTQVNAMTSSVFFSKRAKHEFGIWLAGWLAGTGEMSSPLRSLVATPNSDKGWGASNFAGFSDPELDALIDQAMNTVDDGKRKVLLADASKKSMDLMAVIPLHSETTPWAMKKGLDYKPRADQSTNAFDVKRSTK